MAQSFDPSRYAILIVEDDPFILAEAADLAIEAGFKAYEARNAELAIRMLERYSEIRIVFTDVEMPGSLDGLKLAAAVRKRWPPVQFIVVSGRVKVTAEDMPEHSVFFTKPYDPDAILRTMTWFGERIES
ncbi:MAG: response regulator [Parafilimonas terrae]|nr:response regulator [Parafilimonas terrae]